MGAGSRTAGGPGLPWRVCPAAARSRPWLARALLVLGGAAVALGLGELGLRLVHRRLPSLAAVDALDPRDRGEVQRWTEPVPQPADCHAPPGTHRPAHRPKRARLGTGPRRRVWAVGDSLVQGWGVAPGMSWPEQAAARMAETEGVMVELLRLGSPGLGHCGWVADLHHALDTAPEGTGPDRVWMQLFADDLERRDMVLVNDRVVALPAHPLARRSYLLNRLWFAWKAHQGGAVPDRATDAAGQAAFRRVMRALVDRLDEQGIPATLLLVPPAGIARCAARERPWGDCDWLAADQDLMARLLTAEGIPFVDLRGRWHETDPGTLPDEEQAWTARGRLPVHPGPAGHAAIATAVLAAGP